MLRHVLKNKHSAHYSPPSLPFSLSFSPSLSLSLSCFTTLHCFPIAPLSISQSSSTLRHYRCTVVTVDLTDSEPRYYGYTGCTLPGVPCLPVALCWVDRVLRLSAAMCLRVAICGHCRRLSYLPTSSQSDLSFDDEAWK